MKILRYTFEMGNDFAAIVGCEHCGHEGKLTGGYHDNFYHTQVVPSILCGGCGLNRDGTTTPRQHVNGVRTV